MARNAALSLSQWWLCKGTPTVGPHSLNHKVITQSLFVAGHASSGNHEGTQFVASLRTCAKNKDLCKGIQLHDDILRDGFLDMCANDLIIMYAKCGALDKAEDLFGRFSSRHLFVWTALIAGYVDEDRGQDALNCFEQMLQQGLSPNAVTFTYVLKACGSTGALEKGEKIHDVIAEQGWLLKSIVLGNALISMYAKCGALSKAQQVLEELPMRNVVTWTSLITGYIQRDKCVQALTCFEKMQHEGLTPNPVTFICVLKACGIVKAANKGQQVHEEIAKQGLLKENIRIGNALVDMYVKCYALAKARQVLDELPVRNAISWTALMAGYVEHGEGEEALNCYELMKIEGLSPTAVTFICVLKACGSIKAINTGIKIHDNIAIKGLLGKDVVLGNSLLDMYAKCGALERAQQVLQELCVRDVISWNALIAGYVEQCKAEHALQLFAQMQHDGVFPDSVTFICLLKACGIIGSTHKGARIHYAIAKQGMLENNVVMGTALLDMYVKCGALTQARRVFEVLSVRNTASWTALITGYAQREGGAQALECFEKMLHEGLSPNALTFTCTLKACGCVGAVEKGEQIHDNIAKQGLLGNNIMLGNALVDMYAKFGALCKAYQLLEELPVRNVISWNALIGGYAQHGEHEHALCCLQAMQAEGLSPDAVTFTCVLKSCNCVGAVNKGERFHDVIAKQGLLVRDDNLLSTALVDMYAKCGALSKALQVLEELPVQNVTSWNALISGYAEQCDGMQATDFVYKMQQEGFFPDAVTFTRILQSFANIRAPQASLW